MANPHGTHPTFFLFFVCLHAIAVWRPSCLRLKDAGNLCASLMEPEAPKGVRESNLCPGMKKPKPVPELLWGVPELS